MFGEIDRLKIVFIDGVFSAEESDDLSSWKASTIDRIEDICCKDIHWAKELYGVLEARGQISGATAAGSAEHGLCRRMASRFTSPAKPSKPISLIYRHASAKRPMPCCITLSVSKAGLK